MVDKGARCSQFVVGDVRLPVLRCIVAKRSNSLWRCNVIFVRSGDSKNRRERERESPLAIETNKRSILRTFALFYDRTSLFTSFGPVIRRENSARNHEKRGTGKSSRFSAILWLISWLVMQFSFRLTRVWRREFYQAWKSLLSEEIVRRKEGFILRNISR